MKKTSIIVILLILFSIFLGGCIDNNDTSNKKNIDNAKPDDNGKKDENQYSWSTMNEGPYNDQVSYATGTDLLNWVDTQNILAVHASVPGAIYKDGVIYVYFVDVSEDGVPERIGLLTSSDDAQTWSEKQYITVENVGDKVPVDPAPFLLDDGRIRLYYFDIDEERSSFNQGLENKIYSAISSDGISFVEEGVCFKKTGVFDPDVILVNDVYRLYVGDLEGNRVISATSTDGLNFVEEGIAYTGGAVPDAFYKNNTYYLYTAGIDISTSTDGTSYIKTDYRFESSINMLTADPSVIELNDGSYIMFYKTKI